MLGFVGPLKTIAVVVGGRNEPWPPVPTTCAKPTPRTAPALCAGPQGRPSHCTTRRRVRTAGPLGCPIWKMAAGSAVPVPSARNTIRPGVRRSTGTLCTTAGNPRPAFDCTNLSSWSDCLMRQPTALIACEFSGRVRDALARVGFYAVSCDLLPSETEGEHVQGMSWKCWTGGGIC